MRAPWLAALCGCVALYVASCAAPQRAGKVGDRKAAKAEPPAARPKAEPPAPPKAEPPAPPKAEPAAAPPKALGKEAGRAAEPTLAEKPEAKKEPPKPPVLAKAEPKKAEELRPPKGGTPSEEKAAPPKGGTPSEEKKGPPKGGTPSVEEAKPPKGGTPSKEEAKAAGPPELFLFSPQRRQRFTAGETAEITLVIGSSPKASDARVTLSMADETGRTWSLVDKLGFLPPGRVALTYAIDTACFAPGAYKLSAQLGDQSFGVRDLVIRSSVPRTHFRIGAWIDKPPAQEMAAARWGRVLGLNTVFLPDRSPWRPTVPSAKWQEEFQRIRSTPSARPLELETAAPPFIETADLLTGARLDWIDACAVSGGAQPLLRPDHSVADPAVVLNAHQRIHHRLLAERDFRNCLGVHLTPESALAWAKSGDYEGPFGVPAEMAAFEKFRREAALQAATKGRRDAAPPPKAGSPGKPVEWREGAKKWDEWRAFLMFRAGLLGQALTDWTAAARAVMPNALVTSHLASPLSLADGCYPPLMAKGLPIVTAQIGLDGPAGLLMSPMMADLARMGNARKPVWFMPALADEADLDEMRAAVFLGLGRKIDGVVFPPNLDYHLQCKAPGPLGLAQLSSVGSLAEWLTRYGDLLLALEPPPEDVGILYSVTEHIARLGQDPLKLSQAASYPGTLLAAYAACQFAHFPASFLTEDDVLAGPRCKVVLVIGLTRIEPALQAKLEAHAARKGRGVVLFDPTTKVAIKGARPLRVDFPDLIKYNDEWLRKGEQEKADTMPERRDAVVQTKLIYPLLPHLRAALREHIERAFTANDRDMLTTEQRCGAGRYIFIANDTQRMEPFRGLKQELCAGMTQVTLREGSYRVYKLPEAVLLDPLRIKGKPVVPMVIAAGGSGLLALLPHAIDHVRISRASFSGGLLRLSASVRAQGLIEGWTYRSINAAVPLEIVVTDPAGQERLHIYRAQTPGGYSESLPLGAMAPAGVWKVVVRELLSGAKDEDTFRVRERSAVWARRCGPLQVADGERIRGLLRSPKPLWIVVGTEAEAKKADGLAALLRKGGRTVEIKRADALAKPRPLAPAAAPSYLSAAPKNAPMPDVRQPAILVGNVATHALLQAVHAYGILPRTVTPDYPGPGGALLCWLLSAFEPDVEAVVAAAADDAGVDCAFAALEAAAGGRVPVAARLPLTGPASVAAGEPKGERKPLRLPLACEVKTLDDPMDIATPLSGAYVAAGCFDGTVRAYDTTGKELWGRQIPPGRVRSIATSLDGSWTLAGSFPLIVMLTAKGRPAWALSLAEVAPRSDFTVAATSYDGSLSVIGTLSGKAVGLTLDGQPVFNIGGAVLKPLGEEEEPPPPPKEEKAPPKEERKAKAEPKEKEPAPKDPAEPKAPAPKELKEPPAKEPKQPAEAPGLKEPTGAKGRPEKGPEPKQPAGPKEAPPAFGPIGAVAVSPKAEFAVVAGEDQAACIDPAGAPIWVTKELPRVAALAVSLTEKPLIAVGSRAGFVACVTKEGGEVWRKATKGPVLSVAFLGTTPKVLAASLDGSLTCYDEAGKELWSHRSQVGFRCVVSTPGGQVVAAAEWSGKVFLMDANGEITAETEPLYGVVRGIALSGDGTLLGVALGPATVKVYRVQRGQAEEDEL